MLLQKNIFVSSSTAEGLGLDADLATVTRPKKMGRRKKIGGILTFLNLLMAEPTSVLNTYY